MHKFDFKGIEGYVLENEFLSVELIALGAAIKSIRFAGRELVLGYDDPEDYIQRSGCVGAVIGRYANRIRNGFTIDGVKYDLPANEYGITIHGGMENLPHHKRVWNVEVIRENKICFYLDSPDGDNGFPGNLRESVIYELKGSSLRLDFEGKCDKNTVYGPTTHCYFNLSGRGESIMGTGMQVFAHHYLPVDDKLVPTGEIRAVEGKYDLLNMKKIDSDYDTCFVLDGVKAFSACKDGIRMSMATSYPGMQLYTGEYLGEPFGKNGGFAVEPEFFPDSPNKPQFRYKPLEANTRFHHFAVYTFEKDE